MRRRSTWVVVRSHSGKALHALAGRLFRERMEHDLTVGQEALWDQIIAELEWRSARRRRGFEWCTCALCFRQED